MSDESGNIFTTCLGRDPGHVGSHDTSTGTRQLLNRDTPHGRTTTSSIVKSLSVGTTTITVGVPVTTPTDEPWPTHMPPPGSKIPIIAGVVGGVGGAILIALVVFWIFSRQRSRRRKAAMAKAAESAADIMPTTADDLSTPPEESHEGQGQDHAPTTTLDRTAPESGTAVPSNSVIPNGAAAQQSSVGQQDPTTDAHGQPNIYRLPTYAESQMGIAMVPLRSNHQQQQRPVHTVQRSESDYFAAPEDEYQRQQFTHHRTYDVRDCLMVQNVDSQSSSFGEYMDPYGSNSTSKWRAAETSTDEPSAAGEATNATMLAEREMDGARILAPVPQRPDVDSNGLERSAVLSHEDIYDDAVVDIEHENVQHDDSEAELYQMTPPPATLTAAGRVTRYANMDDGTSMHELVPDTNDNSDIESEAQLRRRRSR